MIHRTQFCSVVKNERSSENCDLTMSWNNLQDVWEYKNMDVSETLSGESVLPLFFSPWETEQILILTALPAASHLRTEEHVLPMQAL